MAGAEKISQYKVRIALKKPFPAALEFLAGPIPIYPNEYYAQVGPKGMNEKPVGTGPYRVTEHQPGRLVRFERNKDYFKDSPKPQPTIEKLELRLIPDRDTQAAELMAGGLDWTYNVPPDQAEKLKTLPHLDATAGETMRIAFLHFNPSEKSPVPAMRDVRVRRAIGHAIDREAILKNIVGGGRVIHVHCFPTQFGCDDRNGAAIRLRPGEGEGAAGGSWLPQRLRDGLLRVPRPPAGGSDHRLPARGRHPHQPALRPGGRRARRDARTQGRA